MAPREPLADFRYRETSAVSLHPRVDRERVEGPDPQVVALPPDDLVERPGINTSSDHRRSSERELAVLMLDLGVRTALGQESLADAL